MSKLLKTGIENLSGMSMDNVVVHKNSHQPAMLKTEPDSSDIHLPHNNQQRTPENWHVIQEEQGKVTSEHLTKGTPVNNNEALNSEADKMGLFAEKNLPSTYK